MKPKHHPSSGRGPEQGKQAAPGQAAQALSAQPREQHSLGSSHRWHAGMPAWCEGVQERLAIWISTQTLLIYKCW